MSPGSSVFPTEEVFGSHQLITFGVGRNSGNRDDETMP